MQKILIAEDNSHIQRMLKLIFLEDALEIDSALDGHAAWQKLQNNQYDLLITDLQMPELDGRSLIMRLYGHGIRLPIVIITAEQDPPGSNDLAKFGVRKIYIKPFSDPYTFRKEILSLIASHKKLR